MLIKKITFYSAVFFMLYFSVIICRAAFGQEGGTKKNATVITVGTVKDFPVGTIKPLPGHKIIVFRDPAGFYAISSECTHAGCELSFKKDAVVFSCPCHGSLFRADGAVERGPASTNLSWYYIEVDTRGNVIVDKAKIIPSGTKYLVKD
jgi:Rieske Fe-S protein